jgi:hypothetical protein
LEPHCGSVPFCFSFILFRLKFSYGIVLTSTQLVQQREEGICHHGKIFPPFWNPHHTSNSSSSDSYPFLGFRFFVFSFFRFFVFSFFRFFVFSFFRFFVFSFFSFFCFFRFFVFVSVSFSFNGEIFLAFPVDPYRHCTFPSSSLFPFCFSFWFPPPTISFLLKLCAEIHVDFPAAATDQFLSPQLPNFRAL